MSVLVACRNLGSEAASRVTHLPIAKLDLPVAYLDALAAWQVRDPASWEAVLSWQGRSWGDLVNDAVRDPAGCRILVEALGAVGRSCDELAIWYAGFPGDVPIVSTPSEFERVVGDQLAAGELEPAARMVRSSGQT